MISQSAKMEAPGPPNGNRAELKGAGSRGRSPYKSESSRAPLGSLRMFSAFKTLCKKNLALVSEPGKVGVGVLGRQPTSFSGQVFKRSFPETPHIYPHRSPLHTGKHSLPRSNVVRKHCFLMKGSAKSHAAARREVSSLSKCWCTDDICVSMFLENNK